MDLTYWELWVRLPQDLEDLWSLFCFERGASGIETVEEIEDSIIQRVFWEKLPEEKLEGYPTEFQQLYDLENTIYFLKESENRWENWQSSWKEFFKPLVVGKHLWVAPPWCEAEAPVDRKLVWIDPGQGFGTGYHASTLLALESLESFMEGHSSVESMLDIGIGSGILAFAACRLGVVHVDGIDIDPVVIDEVERNAVLNQLSDRVSVSLSPPLSKTYPVIIANMLFHELVSVYEMALTALRPQGTLILSGILESQVPQATDCFCQKPLTLTHSFSKEGWTALLLQKI